MSKLKLKISATETANVVLEEGLATSLSSSSTDTEAPSAKVVYDELATKEISSNKVTSISSSSTDTQYPSAKAVYDADSALSTSIAAKENIGKITVNGTEYQVTISSTDAGTAGYITFVVGS